MGEEKSVFEDESGQSGYHCSLFGQTRQGDSFASLTLNPGVNVRIMNVDNRDLLINFLLIENLFGEANRRSPGAGKNCSKRRYKDNR